MMKRQQRGAELTLGTRRMEWIWCFAPPLMWKIVVRLIVGAIAFALFGCVSHPAPNVQKRITAIRPSILARYGTEQARRYLDAYQREYEMTVSSAASGHLILFTTGQDLFVEKACSHGRSDAYDDLAPTNKYAKMMVESRRKKFR